MGEQEQSAFLKAFGDTAPLRVIEFFLENKSLDFSKQDVAEMTELSRSTVYSVWDALLEAEIIAQTRMVGKTRLFGINKQSEVVQHLMAMFDKILAKELDRIAQEQGQMESSVAKVATPVKAIVRRVQYAPANRSTTSFNWCPA